MKLSLEEHERNMRLAILEAQKALEVDEVPIGAILITSNEDIFSAHNLIEKNFDPTAHAEVLVIQKAAEHQRNWRLNDSILYVTLEPCTMCIGAIKQSRISTVVFGAKEPRLGACGSIYDLSIDERTGPPPRVISGVLENECADLLKIFFESKRQVK
jgi:tRNA(adenine34) deaminase